MVPRWRIAEKRKLPGAFHGVAMFSSPVSSSSSMRWAGSTSASSERVASGGSSWLLIGSAWPLILIIAGALAER
jgi:hypothetical protein